MRASAMLLTVLMATACGSGGGEPLADAGKAPPSVSPSLEGSKKTQRFPKVAGPLEPGTYSTARFRPGFSLRVPAGWRLLNTEDRYSLSFAHGPTTDLIVAFLRPVRVVKHGERLSGRTEFRNDQLLPVPDDFVAWITDHPGMEAGSPERVELGGVEATRIDHLINDGHRDVGCPALCAYFFVTPSGHVLAEVGTKIRSYIIESGEATLLVGALAPKPRFTALVAKAESLLAGLEFLNP